MSMQFSVALRNAWAATYESTIGTSPKLRMFTGVAPANCAAASTGTMLVEMSLPSDWLGTPADGSVAKSGTWSGTAAATGTASYYRIFSTAGTVCFEQANIVRGISLVTSALTAVNGNVLTFAAAAGVLPGDSVSGVGITIGTTVLAVTVVSPSVTTITLTVASTLGVANGTTITFGPGIVLGSDGSDLSISNTSITTGQTVTLDTKTVLFPGA